MHHACSGTDVSLSTLLSSFPVSPHIPSPNPLLHSTLLFPIITTHPHSLCILHCLLKLAQFHIIFLVLLKLFLALGQQEGTKGLHVGGTIFIDINLDLVLNSEGGTDREVGRLHNNAIRTYNDRR